MNKKAQSGLIIICVILGVIGGIFWLTGIPIQTVSNGSHTGVITAIEDNGIIFKTTTVYVKTDVSSSQEDKYCLKDKSLIPILRDKETSKQKVTVRFESYLVNGLMNCNGEDAIITGVTNA